MDKNILINIIKTCVVILMVYLPIIPILIKFVNGKIDEWQEKKSIQNKQFINDCIDKAQSVVTDIVLQVNGTFCDSLKKSNCFTQEAQNEAKNKAINTAQVLISDSLKKAVKTVYGDFDTWLDVTIESAVSKQKNK